MSTSVFVCVCVCVTYTCLRRSRFWRRLSVIWCLPLPSSRCIILLVFGRMCLCIYMFICSHLYETKYFVSYYIYVYIYIYIYYIHVCTSTHTYIYTCIHIYIHLNMQIYIYIYIYTYTYTTYQSQVVIHACNHS